MRAGSGSADGSADDHGRSRSRRDRRRRRDGEERRGEEGTVDSESREGRMRQQDLRWEGPTVAERCTKCRMVKGKCARRGQEGHLPVRTRRATTDFSGGGDADASPRSRADGQRRHKRSRTEMGGGGGGGNRDGGDSRQLWRKGTATDSETASDSEGESRQTAGQSMTESDFGECACESVRSNLVKFHFISFES